MFLLLNSSLKKGIFTENFKISILRGIYFSLRVVNNLLQ